MTTRPYVEEMLVSTLCSLLPLSPSPCAHLLVAPLSCVQTAVYQYYDICFWSQTRWSWIEAKLTEMGILYSTNYQVSFSSVPLFFFCPRSCWSLTSARWPPAVVDRSFMFPISTETSRGEVHKHEVKRCPLLPSPFFFYHLALFSRS